MLLERVLDAEQSAFLENELEVVISTTYEKPIPQYKCRMHIPINREAGPAAEVIAVDTYEEVGMSKIISSYSDDWPRVDVVAERKYIPVRPIGDSYGYNFQEVRASAATGKNLSTRRAMAAKRFIMKTENSLAYLGDVQSGIHGLLTYPSTPRVLSDIDMLDPLVSNQIKLERLNQWARIPWELAEFEISAVLFPKKIHGFLTSTPRSEQSDTFLMDLFRKANPTVNFVDWCSECEGAGINGSDVTIFYVREPECVEMHIPQDFEQLPPDDRGKEVIIDCHERFAGTTMNQPLSAVIVEGL